MFENDPKPVRLYQELQIVIPGEIHRKTRDGEKVITGPPSLNVRRHWRTIARDNAEWKEHAKDVALGLRGEWEKRHGVQWRPLQLAALSITFIVPTRIRHDVDNLFSTLKPLLDGVVDAGVLCDDSFEVIRYFDAGVRWEKGRRATIIVVSDMANDE